MSETKNNSGEGLADARRHLDGLWLEGLRQGFYEFTVRFQIDKGKRRRVNFIDGRSDQFVIRPEELEEQP